MARSRGSVPAHPARPLRAGCPGSGRFRGFTTAYKLDIAAESERVCADPGKLGALFATRYFVLYVGSNLVDVASLQCELGCGDEEGRGRKPTSGDPRVKKFFIAGQRRDASTDKRRIERRLQRGWMIKVVSFQKNVGKLLRIPVARARADGSTRSSDAGHCGGEPHDAGQRERATPWAN